MNDKNKQIGKKVKIARVIRDITQKELAKKTGVGYVTMSRIENGARNIMAIEIEKIAKILNRPISYFYEEKDEEYQKVDNPRANFKDLDPKDLEAVERVVSQIREIKRERDEAEEEFGEKRGRK